MSKKYITIPSSELSNIDYANLAMTSPASTPKNLAGDTALIKWYGDIPADVAATPDVGTEMTHAQAMAMLNSVDWQEDLGGA